LKLIPEREIRKTDAFASNAALNGAYLLPSVLPDSQFFEALGEAHTCTFAP
jgi:hypothetical protein